jgi:hypothetical protein
MGIRFSCPNGHRLNVKSFLAGKRGVCPQCGTRFVIPVTSESTDVELHEPVAGTSAQLPGEVSSIPGAVTITTASLSKIIPATNPDRALTRREPVATDVPHTGTPIEISTPESVPATYDVPSPQSVAAVTSGEPAVVRHGRNRRVQLVISMLLLLLVIALAVALIWVLHRDVRQPQPIKTATMEVRFLQQSLENHGK